MQQKVLPAEKPEAISNYKDEEMQQTEEIAETNSRDTKLRVNPEVRGQDSECPVIKTTEKSHFQWWEKEVIWARPIKLTPLTLAYQQSRKAESIKKMN